ncbi:uncharacterized protein A4U43_C06F10450 [Asparagus officinalis]|uniref:Uncharacterized protein n=1 Tax=Asparagus officinalis TaxID=4686 RepID=A0A5P1ERJ5_ASPOF|nr:uncharacterized protein A4U43_C06F10450 [Asparagus officinalis]
MASRKMRPMRARVKQRIFPVVAKIVESVIPLSIPQHNPLSIPQQKNRCQKEELRELEEQKATIDKFAETGVKRELWFNELKKGCVASLASFPSEGCASFFCDCRGKGMPVAF